MVRAVLGLITIGLLAMMALGGYQAALASAGSDVTITNETWTPDAGNVTQLDESGREDAYYDQTVTVRDENDSLMQAGSDYEWHESNGTVKALSGGDLDGDDNATITYGYEEPTREQQRLTGALSQIPRVMGYLVLFAPVLILLLFVRGM